MLILQLDQTTTEYSRQGIKLTSAGIRYELKGWLSCDIMEHVCRGHSMTHHA